MDGELSFEHRDARTIAVTDLCGLVPAVLWNTNGAWQLGMSLLTLTADQVRQIADKLDELNGKDSADAGH